MCDKCSNGPDAFGLTDHGDACLISDGIEAFHRRFGVPSHSEPKGLVGEMAVFRANRLLEEVNEYKEALDKMDAEAQLDALVDLVYIAVGTAYISGFRFAEAFRRVQAANMQKERAQRPEQSKHNTAFDIIKPEGWLPPDLRDLALTFHRVFTKDPEVYFDIEAVSPQDAMDQVEQFPGSYEVDHAVRL